jgi:hypothetical protein
MMFQPVEKKGIDEEAPLLPSSSKKVRVLAFHRQDQNTHSVKAGITEPFHAP